MEQQKRTIRPDWEELEMAMESRDAEMTFYLDIETGKTEMIQLEYQQEWKHITEEYADAETGQVDWQTAFQDRDTADWEQETILLMDAIDRGLGERYLEIPARSSREGFQDMEDFIDTLSSASIKRQLNTALSGRGPFRNFKYILQNYPKEREQWFKFQSERMRKRIVDWLSSKDLVVEGE